jgi:hypothetical protein
VERLEGDNKYHAEQHGLQVSAIPVLCILCFWEEYFGLLFLLLHLVSWFETFVPSEKILSEEFFLFEIFVVLPTPTYLGLKGLVVVVTSPTHLSASSHVVASARDKDPQLSIGRCWRRTLTRSAWSPPNCRRPTAIPPANTKRHPPDAGPKAAPRHHHPCWPLRLCRGASSGGGVAERGAGGGGGRGEVSPPMLPALRRRGRMGPKFLTLTLLDSPHWLWYMCIPWISLVLYVSCRRPITL